MSLLNLALQHICTARDELKTLEHLVKSVGSMAKLREVADSHDGVQAEWAVAMQPVLELLAARMRRLLLKAVPFRVSTTLQSEDIGLLQSCLLSLAEDFDCNLTTQEDLKKMPDFADVLHAENVESSTYMFQRFMDWEEADRTPGVPGLKELLAEPIPLPWMATPKAEHFLKYEEVKSMQRGGLITSERYFPSTLHCSTKSCAIGERIDKGVMATNPKLFTQKNVVTVTPCGACGGPIVIFSVLAKREADALLPALDVYLEHLPAQHGAPLIEHSDDPLHNMFFIRQGRTCGSLVENSYFQSMDEDGKAKFPPRCIYCGTIDDLSDNNDRVAFKQVRPQCLSCVADKERPRVTYGKVNIFTALVTERAKKKKSNSAAPADAGANDATGRSAAGGGAGAPGPTAAGSEQPDVAALPAARTAKSPTGANAGGGLVFMNTPLRSFRESVYSNMEAGEDRVRMMALPSARPRPHLQLWYRRRHRPMPAPTPPPAALPPAAVLRSPPARPPLAPNSR